MNMQPTQIVRRPPRGTKAKKTKLPLPIIGFMITLCIPATIAVYLGSFLITPYRVYMMVMLPVLLPLLFSKIKRFSFYDIFILLYGAWTVMCIFMNVESPIERAGMVMLQSIGAYILARTMVSSVDDARNVVVLMLKIVVISLIFSIPEAITHKKPLLDITSKLTGIPYGVYSELGDVRMGLRRAQAFFYNPILYGLFCASILSMYWYSKNTVRERSLPVLAIFAGTFVSVSSAPLLAFNVQLVAIAIEYFTRGIKNRVTLILAASLIAFIALQSFTGGVFNIIVRYLSFNSGSAYNRVLIWDWGMKNIAAHPLFGREGWEHAVYMKDSLDNFWIAITIQGGIPSTVFLLLGIFTIMVRLGRLPLLSIPPDYSKFRTGWIFSMLAFMFTGYSVHFFGELQPVFFFLIGMGGALVPIYEAKARDSRRLRSPSPTRPPAGQRHRYRPRIGDAQPEPA